MALGAVELSQRHTAFNLKMKVEEIYASFGIQSWQIYAVTVDNASNVVKAVDMMAEDQYTEPEEEEEGNDEEAEEKEEEDKDSTTDEDVQHFKEVINEYESSLGGPRLSLLRCAAHTLNLVVNDVLKIEDIDEEMKCIIRVAKAYRKTHYRKFMKTHGIKKPPLPGVTRWNRHQEMLVTMQENQKRIEKAGEEFSELGKN